MEKNIIYDFILPFFCADDELRPQMKQISLEGDLVAASNGHIAIMLPRKACTKEYTAIENYPNITKLYEEKAIARTHSVTIKTDDLIKMLTITKWIRSSKMVKCKECEGSGQVDWEYKGWGKEDDCPSCYGDGHVGKDPIEFGILHTDGKFSISIADVSFSADYLHIIAISASMLRVDEIQLDFSTNGTAIFHLGEARILLMALLSAYTENSTLIYKAIL